MNGYGGVNWLPNIKSSERSVKTDALRKAANSAVKSELRGTARKVVESIKAGEQAKTTEMLSALSSIVDNAARKGIIHKNAAARKKSRLAKAANKAVK